ncbi:MAG: hypothetical protein EOP51_30295, partial [Sphingobacteriales bacterium]
MAYDNIPLPTQVLWHRFSYLIKANNSGQLVWSKRIEAVQSVKVAVALNGSGYIIGESGNGVVELGNNIALTLNNPYHFVAGFNAAGQFQWIETISGVSEDYSHEIAIDPAGNAVIAKVAINHPSSPYSASFGSTTFPANPDVGMNLLLMKITSNGTLLWGRIIPNLGSNYSASMGLDIDAGGEIVLAAAYKNLVQFNDSVGYYPHINGQEDIIISRFTGQGGYLWSQTIAVGGTINFARVGLDNDANVYVGGKIYGLTASSDIAFGNNITFSSSTNTFSFLAKLSGNANEISGRVYLDINSSGTQNTNEAGLPQIPVLVQTSATPVLSQPNGNYIFYTTPGNYQVTIPQVPTYYLANPASHSASFIGTGNRDTANHFGFQPIEAADDLQVLAATLNFVRAGSTHKVRVFYRNVGTTVMNGTVSLSFDTMMTFVSAVPVASTVNGLVA